MISCFAAFSRLVVLIPVSLGAESIEGMQSPRSACSVLDGQAWPACGDVADLLHLYAAAWEESCVLWRRRCLAWPHQAL